MHQRAKIDMNAVGGYKTSTFGNIDFIKSSNINNNSGSTNINIYADQEEIDYSDDSFNGLTTEDILQEKINWKKNQIDREKNEKIQNDKIANIQQSIDVINNAIDAIDQELLEFENLKNISSVDSSLANLFPACLYDSDYLDDLTDDEFEIIIDIFVRYELESSNLDIAQFKENVKSGKYLKMMLETTGSSMESLWCDNIERYLGESSNRRQDIGLYDSADRHTGKTENRLIGIIYDCLPRGLYEEDRALAYYMSYLSSNSLEDQYELDNLIFRLKEAVVNGTYEQFRDEIILQGKREVFKQLKLEGTIKYDYDDVKSSLERYTLQYFNGKIDAETYRIYFARIMTGDDSITKSTINRYPGASNIRVPSIEGLENDFYLMIAEQYNDRAQQIKSEKAELNRMLTQYKNYKLECELLNLISTDDFEKYKKLDGVSIDSEYKEIMTDEELANYAYLYNKFGQDKAKQYITSKEEEFNSRVGLERAYDFISQLTVDGKFKNYDDMTLEEKEQLENLGFDYSAYNMLITGGKGLEEGFESFFEGLVNVFNSDGVKSANDYERMYISMLLSSNWLLSGTYDITSSIGNMAFPMLISTLASIASANPTLGAAIGSTLMGLSSGGNSLEGMLQEGWSFQESFTYGVLTGLSETTLGFFLGGIPGLSKLDDIPGVKGFLSNMFKEGMEESTQSILEPYLKYLSTGVEQKINWEEVAKSGIYGMITSGLISGGKILIQGNYVSIDKLDPEAIEKIAEAQNAGIELEITEEMLTDSIKAEEAVNNAMKSSTFDRVKNKLYLNNQQKISEPVVFDFFKNSISNARSIALTNGDMDIVNMLDKLYLLKNSRPDFGVYYDVNNGAYSQAYTDGSIYLGETVINGNQTGVVYHELGHTLHGAINNSAVPSNYMDVKSKVYEHMSNNTAVVEYYTNYIQQCANSAATSAANYFDTYMSASVIEQLNQINWDEVRDNYRQMGFSEENIEMMVTNDYNAQYNNIRNNEIYKLADIYQRQWGIDAFSDIIGSVYNGTKRFAILDSNGNKIYLGGDLSYNHDIDYYQFNVDVNGNVIDSKTLVQTNEAAFHEQIANYVQLKLSGNQQMLDALSNLLGNEWIQMMETEFNKITDYFK